MSALLNRISGIAVTISLILTYLLGFGSVSSTPNVTLVGTDKLALTSAMYAGQGIATDGEYYYTSGSITAVNMTALAKWDLNFNRVESVLGAVPDEFRKSYGSNHIGGIDCAGGYIYAPVEADGYERNFVLLYDCETLDYTGIFYEIKNEDLTDGIAWCAVDAENGYFYTSRFNDVTKILRFKLSDMSFDGEIVLSEKIYRVQGGAVCDGVLYTSYDVRDSVDEKVMAVDLATGEVSVAFERYLCNYDNEAEDILIYPMPDGSLFHLLDYDKLVSMNIRHYKWTDGKKFAN